jgi:hypothetical protein
VPLWCLEALWQRGDGRVGRDAARAHWRLAAAWQVRRELGWLTAKVLNTPEAQANDLDAWLPPCPGGSCARTLRALTTLAALPPDADGDTVRRRCLQVQAPPIPSDDPSP